MGYVGVKPSAVPLTSADITDGIIVNADINATAAIALTKLASTGTLTVDNIQFPATQVTSSNANNLDDYEEGTFTPSITFGGGSTSIVYNTGRRIGVYTKIGNTVFYFMHIDLTDKGSSTGSLNITGLPFTVAGSEQYVPSSVFYEDMSSITGTVVFRALTGTTTCDAFQLENSYSAITNSNFTNTTGVQLSGFYRI
jgi:hypothetical protein